MPSPIQFQEIQIGQFFEFRGRRYKKLALSMASDEDRYGTIFMAQTEVGPDPLAQVDHPTQEADRAEVKSSSIWTVGSPIIIQQRNHERFRACG